MSRYRIHIDPKLPDPKRIHARKDFDSLYDHYQVHTRFAFWRQLYRNPKNFGMVAIIAAIAFLVFQASEESLDQASPKAFQAPVAAWQLQPTTYTINPSQDTVLTVGQDMTLAIPQAAFWQADSQAVAQPLELSVQVLTTPLAWLRAGIPMSDSVQFVSGPLVLGITASLGDHALRLAPAKTLRFRAMIQDTNVYSSTTRFDDSGSRKSGMNLIAKPYADTLTLLSLGPKPIVPPSPFASNPHMARLDSAENAIAIREYEIQQQLLALWEEGYARASLPIGYVYEVDLETLGYVGWVASFDRPFGSFPSYLFIQGGDTLGYSVEENQVCLSYAVPTTRKDTCFSLKRPLSLKAFENWLQSSGVQ